MHPWDWPEQPWQWIDLDYAGLFMSKLFFIAIDAHSKWMEVDIATTQATVECLQLMFAQFGLSKVMVTHDRTCFTISDFAEFNKHNKICHVWISAYHPSNNSNGLVERAVHVLEWKSGFLVPYKLNCHTSCSTTGWLLTELQVLLLQNCCWNKDHDHTWTL